MHGNARQHRRSDTDVSMACRLLNPVGGVRVDPGRERSPPLHSTRETGMGKHWDFFKHQILGGRFLSTQLHVAGYAVLRGGGSRNARRLPLRR